MNIRPKNKVLSDNNQLLFQLELIANTFTGALDDNACILKVAVGLHYQLDDLIEEIKDLKEIVEIDDAVDRKDPVALETLVPNLPVFNRKLTDGKNKLKKSCNPCKSLRLKKPKFSYANTLDFSIEKGIEINSILKKFFSLKGVNPCHAAFTYEKMCVPQILQFLLLLVNAVTVILSLNKIKSISFMGFIKGIIMGLLVKLIGSFKLSVDMGNTNLHCYIQLLEDTIKAALDVQEAVEPLLDGEVTSDELKQARAKNDLYFKQYVKQNTQKIENFLPEILKEVNSTFTSATKRINDFFEQLAGLITHFQCENTRAYGDKSEIGIEIAKYIKLINLLSAIASVVAKKQVKKLKLCKEDTALSSRSLATGNAGILEDVEPEEFTKEDLKNIVEQYTGYKTVLQDAADITALVYQKPIRQLLPKLDLFTCNLEEFLQAHTLDNIVKAVFEEEEIDPDDNIDSIVLAPFEGDFRDPVLLFKFEPPSTDLLPDIVRESLTEKERTTLNQQAKTEYEAVTTDIRSLIGLLYEAPSSGIESGLPSLIELPTFRNDVKTPRQLEKQSQTSALLQNRECKSVEDALNILNSIKI